MRFLATFALAGLVGCSTAEGRRIPLPEVYPPVRTATPTSLIADPQYQSTVSPLQPEPTGLGQARKALGEGISLGTAVQERFYSGGPTALLRIVKDLDDRVAPLDTDPSKHSCLTAAPISWTYDLPAGQHFTVKLQCLQEWGTAGSAGGWVAFGFEQASVADAGPTAASDGNDFYIVEGQSNGMGGAYRISGATGSVEGWLTVADRTAPNSSTVVMHLLTDKAAGTLELTLGGWAVGFCSAHLKTNTDHLFVSGKTNAPPPPGSPMTGQYCDAIRAGCYAPTALDIDLGASASDCALLAAGTFEMGTNLDASTDTGANVTTTALYEYFSHEPTGIPEF